MSAIFIASHNVPVSDVKNVFVFDSLECICGNVNMKCVHICLLFDADANTRYEFDCFTTLYCIAIRLCLIA